MNRLTSLLFAPFLVSLVTCGGGSPVFQSPPPVSVAISPSNASSLVNQSTQFSATVTGTSNTAVTWSVQSANGAAAGTISSRGLYTAPWANGMYRVVAKSVADPTKTASATVGVSAKFAYIEQILGGATSLSAKAMVGTIGADGSFTSTPINGQSTEQPLNTDVRSIFLSSDAKKVVFDTNDFSIGILVANADGSKLSTQCDVGPPCATQPQFSPDVSKIIFISIFSTAYQVIKGMDTDGSNTHVILGTCNGAVLCSGGWVPSYPSFSPDGTKIVTRLARLIGNLDYDGIAVMNADGTNLIQLTGALDPNCNPGWDEMPTFTNDGKHIAFSRLCWIQPGDIPTENLYIMNPDGTNITKLQGNEIGNTILFQPRAVGDKLVFSSNLDNPGTNAFELYSIMPDGSKLTRLTNNSVYDGLSNEWINFVPK